MIKLISVQVWRGARNGRREQRAGERRGSPADARPQPDPEAAQQAVGPPPHQAAQPHPGLARRRELEWLADAAAAAAAAELEAAGRQFNNSIAI